MSEEIITSVEPEITEEKKGDEIPEVIIEAQPDPQPTEETTTTTELSSSSSSSSSSTTITTKPKKKINASVALTGIYKPATFVDSPPPPPEGYVLSHDEWEDLLDGSRKMKLLNERRAATIHAGDMIASYDDIADETDDARSATRALAQRREAELAARAQQEPPKSIFGRAVASVGAAFSSIAYSFNRIVAYVQDEAKRESRERSARRFEELNLSEEQRLAAGALMADFYCRTVVRAPEKVKQKIFKGENVNNEKDNEKVSEIHHENDNEENHEEEEEIIKEGRAAAGWLFLTEHWLIFDGDIMGLPGDVEEDEDDDGSKGHCRFVVLLNKVASFTGAVWQLSALDNATGGIPEFTYSERRERQIKGEESPYREGEEAGVRERATPDADEDALIIYDQRGAMHQFWDFNSQFGGNAFNVLCTFNNVWRNAMLGV